MLMNRHITIAEALKRLRACTMHHMGSQQHRVNVAHCDRRDTNGITGCHTQVGPRKLHGSRWLQPHTSAGTPNTLTTSYHAEDLQTIARTLRQQLLHAPNHQCLGFFCWPALERVSMRPVSSGRSMAHRFCGVSSAGRSSTRSFFSAGI